MSDRKSNGAPVQMALGACPTCGKPAVQRFRPFCSKRCADVDLHRWLSGQYAIPVTEEEDEDGGLPERGSPAIDVGEDER